jgi:hypothetical protein
MAPLPVNTRETQATADGLLTSPPEMVCGEVFGAVVVREKMDCRRQNEDGALCRRRGQDLPLRASGRGDGDIIGGTDRQALTSVWRRRRSAIGRPGRLTVKPGLVVILVMWAPLSVLFAATTDVRIVLRSGSELRLLVKAVICRRATSRLVVVEIAVYLLAWILRGDIET